MSELSQTRIPSVKNDVLSGTVVAIALIPEAVAFSLVAGLSPIVGLHTAFMLGLITALLGGKPGMISGATGAMVVVLAGLAASHGLEYVLWASILTGLIQISIGAAGLGKFIRLVPQPAIFGFVNGLAIVIMMAQFPLFDGENWIMYALVGATMAIVWLFPKLTSVIPSSLAAIIAISAVVIGMDLDTKRVADLADISGSLPSFHIPTAPINLDTLMTILPYSVILALVGLIESLLTLAVLDEMGGQRGAGNRECIAQGIGNTTCGFFGGMAGCAMIGQSIINFTSGGLTRLSGITASVLLIIFVVSLADYIGMLPVAALVGIMFMVCVNTFEWGSFSRLKRMPKADAVVLVSVTVITVFADLAVAVICGVIIAALVFAWQHARISIQQRLEDEDVVIYELEGPLFFGSATAFGELFKVERDPHNVIIDFANTRVMDSSGVEAIDKLTRRYLDDGKKVVLRHLSEDCIALLNQAGPFCTHELDSPTYKVAIES
ncbi:SulP family inorganic anion transporter [Atopomonas sediminilitoris]|uniref:SulP family inorganic anion transporter n=1 Tax=Atopomonas sediminilitoris TaxID=2919919 RepID=UPI001F4E04BC|nr:SulP family inorganic anion transporter [Atopomonas sediminilitoris]MCJ8169192.1 SulP family inorganic anion transporter [Atopomonas sediminilitoris]